MNPAIAMIDICVIEAVFPAGGTVNLATLKEQGVVLDTAEVLKVYASGSMTKPLTVEAHQFTLDAIRAISEAGGDSAMIR
jgi:large subunit ribosomal protein L15